MQKIIELLNKTQFGFLATIENNQPRVRPFQFQFADKNRIYFSSFKSKNIVKQLEENPVAEFSAFDKTFHYIRINGRVFFTYEEKIKEKIFKLNPYFKEKLRLSDIDELVVFYLEPSTAHYGYYDKYPPETIVVK